VAGGVQGGRDDEQAAVAADVEALAELGGAVRQLPAGVGEQQVLAAGSDLPAGGRQRPVVQLEAGQRGGAGGPSTSRPTSPEAAPVTTPTFAAGHRRHQMRSWPASRLASWRPRRNLGCLPIASQLGGRHEQPPSPVGVCMGRTGQPSVA